MQNPQFVNYAKSILQDIGKPFNCYHEAKLTGRDNQELFSMLYYAPSDKYMEFTYTPEKAPCMEVLNKGHCAYIDNIQKLFPEDKGLVQVKAQAYIGCKTKLGLKAVLSPDAIQNASATLSLLKKQTPFNT